MPFLWAYIQSAKGNYLEYAFFSLRNKGFEFSTESDG